MRKTFPPIQLQALREDRGLRQAQISKDLGIERSLWYSWERGLSRPSYAWLWRLADYFECSVDEIMGRQEGDLCKQTIG